MTTTTFTSIEDMYIRGLKALANKTLKTDVFYYEIVDELIYLTNGKVAVSLNKDLYASLINKLPKTYYNFYAQAKNTDHLIIDVLNKVVEDKKSFAHFTSFLHEHKPWYGDNAVYRVMTVKRDDTLDYVYIDDDYKYIMDCFMQESNYVIIGNKECSRCIYETINSLGCMGVLMPINTSSEEIKNTILKDFKLD